MGIGLPVAPGRARTHEDVLNLAARLAGTKPPILLAPELVRVAARLTAPVEKMLPIPHVLTAEAALSGIGTYYGDAGKARRKLGWIARPLEEGMAETVASIQR